MTKKVSKTAAHRGSKQVKTDSSTCVVFDLRKRMEIPPRIRKRLWESMLPFVPLQLLASMENALVGFNVRVQLLMIDALNDYLSDKGQLFTMISTVDDALGTLYCKIDDFLLEQECQH